MFARALELTTRRGKLREVLRTLREQVVPTMNTQPGFVDQFILSSDAEPDRIVVLTMWTRREHAEWFHRHHYSKIRRMLEPLLEFDPVIRTFNVEDGPLPRAAVRRPPLGTRPGPA